VGAAPEIKVHRSLNRSLQLFDADRFRWLDEAAAAGPLTALRMGPVKVWVITDPDLARTVLVTDAATWTRPPATVVPIRMGVGENLFTQSDANWARVQPAVAPAFRRKAVDARLADVPALVDEEIDAIPAGTATDLELAMGRIALSVAAWVLLGERLDPGQADVIARHQREVVGWVGLRLGQLTGFLPVAVGRRARVMKEHRAVLDAYADDVIARAQAAGAPADDVLGALLRARPGGKPLTGPELRGQVLGLFLAGNETTAAALSWALVHGAGAPHEWAKLRDDPEHATVPFVTESLRLTPAVWGIPRTPTRAGVTVQVGSVTARVRRGQVATIYLRGINRDPRRWDDPLRFDPSRHDDAAKDQHRALLPFGLGPRGCIGQHLALAEMGIVLPALARRGTFTIDGPTTEDARFALRVGNGLTGRFVPAVADPVAASDGQA
jgi:cytochrome P450